MAENQEYGMFKTHLDSHIQLAYTAEEILKDTGKELDTPTLARKIPQEEVDGLKESYRRSLLLEGREWIEENTDIKIQERSQETGGNATVYWKAR